MGSASSVPIVVMNKLPVVRSLFRALRPRKARMHISTYPIRYQVRYLDGLVEIRISDNSDADQAAIRGDWIAIGNDMRKAIEGFRIHQGA